MHRLSIFIFTLFSAVLCCFFTNASALDLELTQGVSKAIPIAVVAFSNPSVAIAGNTTMARVITQDLTNSGRFSVTPVSNAVASQALDTDHYNHWRQMGVSDVVFGTIQSKGAGHYTVQVQLIDVYTRALLWHVAFDTTGSDLRKLSHQISNAIYQKLTGLQGIFTTKIAYVLTQGPIGRRRYMLEVADQDGFNAQPLVVSAMPIMSPVWSPDGQQIVYVSFEHHRAAIYLQNVADGSRIKMSALPGINGAPAFSPDGKSLAMVRSVTGVPKIYLMQLASGKVTQLTHGYAMDTEPSFSPDGSKLMFTSSRDGGVQIYQKDLTNGQVTRLSYTGDYNASGHYFPNGKGFVLLHREQGVFSIAKQDLSVFGRLQVLDRSESDESPAMSPNGQMVMFSTDYQGHRVLAMVSIEGRVRLRLPSSQGSVSEPAWSPIPTTPNF